MTKRTSSVPGALERYDVSGIGAAPQLPTAVRLEFVRGDESPG